MNHAVHFVKEACSFTSRELSWKMLKTHTDLQCFQLFGVNNYVEVVGLDPKYLKMAHGGGDVGVMTVRLDIHMQLCIYIYIRILSNAAKYINMEPIRCDQSNIHVLHVRGIRYAYVIGLMGHGFT